MRNAHWLIWMVLAAFGCAGTQKQESPSPAASPLSKYARCRVGAPKWVKTKRCTKEVVDNPKESTCGVGMHEIGPGGLDLAETTAQAAGRADIAKRFSVEAGSLLERTKSEYGKTVGERKGGEAIQKVSDAVVQISKMRLQGAQPADSWISPCDEAYVLLVVVTESVRKSLLAMKGLSSEIKRQIDQNHEDLIGKLNAAPTQGQ